MTHHTLFETIRTLTNDIGVRYLFDVSECFNSVSRKVIGFNASASSLFRKKYTLERVSNYIKMHNLPLEVDDYLGEGYVRFRIMIKR